MALKASQELEEAQPLPVQVEVKASDLPQPLEDMMRSHVAWLQKAGAATLGDWVRPLKEIMQVRWGHAQPGACWCIRVCVWDRWAHG
jgi:hypothetical protein